MKDFFGNDIEVGDIVAFNRPGYKYLVKGTVVKLNKKMLRIAYGEPKTWLGNKPKETNEYPTDCIKEIK